MFRLSTGVNERLAEEETGGTEENGMEAKSRSQEIARQVSFDWDLGLDRDLTG